MKELLIILLLICMTNITTISQDLWAVAKEPTPVLNTSDFPGVFGGADGITLAEDGEGLIRGLEFIALPGTVFQLQGEYDYGAYKIFFATCEEYQYNTPLYIDSRFVDVVSTKPPEREKKLPTKDEIYRFLDSAVGYRYCWAGNYIHGIEKMYDYYQPKGEISGQEKREWILEGCDCSGLMYQATNGYTERNTVKLVNFGNPVDIEGLTVEEIKAKVKPLDMMVWNGHVIYVYDNNYAIQSSLSKGGVVKTDLLETIQHIMSTRRPVNDYDKSDGERFVVRRWYHDS